MKFRKIAPSSIIATMLVTAGLVMSPTASASTSYRIDPNEVCRWDDHTSAAAARDGSNPYTWTCYDTTVTYPFAPNITTTVAGALDMQGYCNTRHPGTRAIATDEHKADSWVCTK